MLQFKLKSKTLMNKLKMTILTNIILLILFLVLENEEFFISCRGDNTLEKRIEK